MRPFIAVIVGWLLYIPLLLIFTILAFTVSGVITKYQHLPKNEIARISSQNPGELIGIGIGVILAIFFTITISCLVAGLIARNNGAIVGSIVSSLILIIGILGSISRNSFNLHPASLLVFVIILALGAISGHFGAKLSQRKSNT